MAFEFFNENHPSILRDPTFSHKQRSHISSVKEVLDDLIANGTRISQRLYDDALTIAEE
ncbi:DUF3368 domain-containing protein [Coleofasciculus sp. H7-2]|uniref:DUF3368 domain-containing protein n=1 Tax=Coleofasciculus sp. H7-2 TaxID=3351545 RepID=UPI00366CDB34